MPFVWTARKAAALARKQAREREGLPLFADQVAADQPNVEEVKVARAASWSEWQRGFRQYAAESWRRARRALRALPAAERTAVLAKWNGSRCPGAHEYFGDAVWQVYRRLGLVGSGHAGSLAEYEQAIATLRARGDAR